MFNSAYKDMDSQELKTRKIIENAIKMMTSYVLPIYKMYKNKPEQIGSGFFVHSSGQYFLITAAHVLIETRKNELFIYIEPNKQMRLAGNVRTNSDDIDVGVIKLTHGLMPPYLAVKKVAIDIMGLKPRLFPRSGKLLAIVGFPASKSKINPIDKSVSVSAYGYYENSIDDEAYALNNLSLENHLAMKLDLKKGSNLKGEHRNFPKPNGMSGSPIWLLHDYKSDEEQRAFPIVGIGIEYRKRNRILVGTDISYCIELIKSYT
jgi:hypothetical protein